VLSARPRPTTLRLSSCIPAAPRRGLALYKSDAFSDNGPSCSSTPPMLGGTKTQVTLRPPGIRSPASVLAGQIPRGYASDRRFCSRRGSFLRPSLRRALPRHIPNSTSAPNSLSTPYGNQFPARRLIQLAASLAVRYSHRSAAR
jgi:hypothetical protein